ncbi:MAG: DUF58 domain-containing protein [Bacteroidia bacterium]|nr:DUF58 domain-containing protein [Bacteroidia bacterium]
MADIKLDTEHLLQTGNLELLAQQVIEGFITGLHKSPYHGFSVEFAEHRLYNTGESTRHIDWKLFARTEKLFTKRYEEETNLRCYMAIDCSSSMFFPKDGLSKIGFSVYAAASLIQLLSKQRDASGICLFDEQINYLSEARATGVHRRLLFSRLEELLQKAPENKQSNIASVLHELSESIHKRSMVIVFTDMLDSAVNPDELFSALQHLRFNKHEVILFHVSDKKLESEFNFSNRPHIFVDMETGERMKLQPQALREQYLKAWAAYKQELMTRSMQYKIDFVEAEVGTDFSQVLLPFVVKRAKLF